MGKQKTRLWFARIACRLCARCGVSVLLHGQRICTGCDWRLKKEDDPVVMAYKVAYEALKDEAIRKYGGYVCACCGYSHRCGISIDHVNGGGSAHLMFIKSIGYRSLYHWLKVHDYPPGFQILCMGCNYSKSKNNGVCPHKGVGATPEFDAVAHEILKNIIMTEYQEFLEKSGGKDFVDHDKSVNLPPKVDRRQKEDDVLVHFFKEMIKTPMNIREILAAGKRAKLKCRTWSYDRVKRLLRRFVKSGELTVIRPSIARAPAVYKSTAVINDEDCEL